MSVADQLEKAVNLNEQGKVALAVACLDEVIDVVPDEAAYQKFVGLIYQSLGEDSKSYRFLCRAVELNPTDPELQRGLGYHFMDNGEPEVSVGHFRRALADDEGSAEATINLARALDFVGKYPEAIALLHGSLLLGNEYRYDALCHLGRVLIHDGRPADAISQFEDALAVAPEDAVIAEMGIRRAQHLSQISAVTSTPKAPSSPATVVCVKHGTLYGAQYVNRLASMVRRNTSYPIRFVCFTEDPSGLDDTVEHRPLPVPGLNGWWNKVALFSDDLGEVGERILFMDLDVVITGSLDPLLCYPSDFAIMENDYVTGFNTSVMLLRVGTRTNVWGNFTPQVAEKFGGDQDWVAMNAPDADLWPAGWCVPYRLRAAKAPPPDCRIVCFCGRPNPDEYPAPWIAELWR